MGASLRGRRASQGEWRARSGCSCAEGCQHGKPDLAGLWHVRQFAKYHGNFATDLGKVPFGSLGEGIYKEHMEKLGAEDPSTRCLPSGVPRFYGDPFPFKILQQPGITMMLLESGTLFRQIFTDGRERPIRAYANVARVLRRPVEW